MSSKSPPSSSDAPLPSGWTRGYSKSQKRNFYYHTDTKFSQWHPPTEDEARDPLKAKKTASIKAKAEQSSSSSSSKRPKEKNDVNPKKQSSSGSKRDSLGSIVSSVELKKHSPSSSSSSSSNKKLRRSPNPNASATSTNVAIIVPYRDIHPEQNRSKHLSEFLPYMHNFLSNQISLGSISDYHIYIVEQSSDSRKFNRGKLLNIGFDYARRFNPDHDVFIFHDVDLLPGDDLGSWYSRFPKSPIHIARVWGRYSNNPKYFGGIVSFSASDMRRINGYPNTFWGWGGEDDEMQKRCERLRIRSEYPIKGTVTDLEQMNIKEKMNFLRTNKSWKCQAKWECLEEHDKTWRTNGLSDLTYSVIHKTNLDEKDNRATKLTADVKLNGTHWSNDKVALDYIGY